MTAVTLLQKTLRSKPGAIEYAGTKDKRAITTQHCTIYRKKPSDFKRVNSYQLPPFIRVGDFELVSEPLKLGDNTANHFDIILREIEATDEDVHLKLEAVRDCGFINYFGLQRFGKGGVHSHIIGREIFHSNWQVAIDMMFVPREGDRGPISQGKQAYNEGDFRAALEIFPGYMHAERSVLASLIQHPNDALGAFNKIPKNTRLLCAHAYQSYVWNVAASERIKRYGLTCVEGDLVVAKNESELAFQKASIENHKCVIVATKEDIESKRYSINDVVLPLVGINVLLPKNDIGELIEDTLRRDSLSIDFFQKKCAQEYRMGGAYRRLILRPKEFQWEILEYNDTNAELFKTEVNKFRSSATHLISEEPVNQGSRNIHALRVSFILMPGSYATMLLREITKESTETEYHASLTASSASEFAGEDEEQEENITGIKRSLEVE